MQSLPVARAPRRTLGDQILALANSNTQQEIAASCHGVRANHIGIAIARHKRAGRIEERDGKLSFDGMSNSPDWRAPVEHRRSA